MRQRDAIKNRFKQILQSKSGESFPLIVAVALALLMILCGITEYMRLNIIAQGVRDAVQTAIISTVNDNYDDVYHGVREGYSGGYQPNDSSFEEGSYAIDFVQEFYDMSFPEAVSFLLGGEQGAEWRRYDESGAKQEKKEFVLPEAHTDMRRVYAYLMKKRFIDREVISHFAHAKTLYEDAKYHNAVFVGTDENGIARHAHKKGTYSDGDSFRANVTGSEPQYSFRHVGEGDTLHVFEAPIDLLSFLSLYPKDWRQQSYVTLDGVSEHAMLYVLERNPQITKVRLCLDHDPAGIEAAGRLREILRERGYTDIAVYAPHFKDWNEDVKARNGVTPIPAQEHPKIVACGELLGELSDICSEKNTKAATCQEHCSFCGNKKAARFLVGPLWETDTYTAIR